MKKYLFSDLGERKKHNKNRINKWVAPDYSADSYVPILDSGLSAIEKEKMAPRPCWSMICRQRLYNYNLRLSEQVTKICINLYNKNDIRFKI